MKYFILPKTTTREQYIADVLDVDLGRREATIRIIPEIQILEDDTGDGETYKWALKNDYLSAVCLNLQAYLKRRRKEGGKRYIRITNRSIGATQKISVDAIWYAYSAREPFTYDIRRIHDLRGIRVTTALHFNVIMNGRNYGTTVDLSPAMTIRDAMEALDYPSIFTTRREKNEDLEALQKQALGHTVEEVLEWVAKEYPSLGDRPSPDMGESVTLGDDVQEDAFFVTRAELENMFAEKLQQMMKEMIHHGNL